MPDPMPDPAGDPTAAPLVLAARWRRGLARFLDYLSMIACLFALQIIGVTSWFLDEVWSVFLGVGVLSAIVEIVYLAKRGQTPAKELFKIRVVRQGVAGPLGWSTSLVRWLVPGLALALPWWTIPIALVVLGAPAFFDAQRRTLWDRLAGTIVVPYDAKMVEGPIKQRPRLIRNPLERNLAAVSNHPEILSDEDDDSF
jgi:uncharacterized RDD family membrane protein YckC